MGLQEGVAWKAKAGAERGDIGLWEGWRRAHLHHIGHVKQFAKHVDAWVVQHLLYECLACSPFGGLCQE
jgi:hypothetical protein